MGVGVGVGVAVADTHTQFRHLQTLNFVVFEGKKLTLARKATFLSFHVDEKYQIHIFP